jgi:hypothetical protein
VARLYLDNIPSIQSSWVTQGEKIGQMALFFGANDMGSLMLEENVVAEAGTVYHLSLDEIRRCISDAGYIPRQRNVYYELIDSGDPAEQNAKFRAYRESLSAQAGQAHDHAGCGEYQPAAVVTLEPVLS